MKEAEIVAENLLEAEKTLCEGWEMRYAQLRELSRSLSAGLPEKDQNFGDALSDAYRTVTRRVREGRAEKKQRTEQNAELKTELNQAQDAPETVLLDTLFAESDLHSRVELAAAWAVRDDPFPLPVCTPPKEGFAVACFGNLYSDRALLAFSDLLGGMQSLPVEDYASACEEVSEGDADFCILPIESARDGVMDRFEQMIDNYSLFSLLKATVQLSDEDWIRFALLAPFPCRLSADLPADRIQLKIASEGEPLWQILRAGELLGAKLLECRLSDRSDERAPVARLTFSASDRGRAALIAYLELGRSGYTLTGCFQEIS